MDSEQPLSQIAVFLWRVSDGTPGQMPCEAHSFVFFFLSVFAAHTAGRLGQHQLVRTQTPGQGEMVRGVTARRFLVLATGLLVGGGWSH